jgi:hypothetical protein
VQVAEKVAGEEAAALEIKQGAEAVAATLKSLKVVLKRKVQSLDGAGSWTNALLSGDRAPS